MGADIDWLDKNGLAPVEYACIYENYDLLKILVNAGCKINWKDHNSLIVCAYTWQLEMNTNCFGHLFKEV